MTLQPEYNTLVQVCQNQQPSKLPVYEHIISPQIMESVLNTRFADLDTDDSAALDAFFQHYCHFFQKMTYDTVSYEVCITEILPDRGALMGGRPGPIQNRTDFERYPWNELPDLYWQRATPRFDALKRQMPAGMKAVGGIGNGVFEISEDLVGYEYLCYMQIDDPHLFADLYRKIGDLMVLLWERFLVHYGNTFAICRFGDDLGYKGGTLMSPDTLRQHIVPQVRRVVDRVHGTGHPFLWHSCGNNFDIMDDMIEAGIDAKHSNEDVIAPFETWIERYSNRIGLLGGIDVDILCQDPPDRIIERVMDRGRRYRQLAGGYALGSGNSIPDYVPVDGYLAMIEAAIRLREETR